MATTNLHQAKHINGRPLSENDISVGLTVIVRSLTSGVLQYECVSRNAEKAEFKSLNKDWPVSFEMKFNQPEFNLKDFESLYVAMIEFDRRNHLVSTEHRQLIRHAHELGYVNQRSHTQANWTEKGCDTYKNVKESAPDTVLNGYKIRYNPHWNKWQASHAEVGGSEEFSTQGEAIDYANKGVVCITY